MVALAKTPSSRSPKNSHQSQNATVMLVDQGPAFVWIRLPNTRRRELLAWFETVLPDIVSALERGATLIEVVR
jgi:hypothetical protein